MKKIIYILLFGLTITNVFAMENSAEDTAIADLIAELSENEPQGKFKNDIQTDLTKLENDIQRAEGYHEQEKEFEAKEEEKAREAAALLELIRKEAITQQNLEQNDVIAPTQSEQSEAQIAQEIKQDQTKGELETLDKTKQEILQEPALQDDVQEALDKADDIEIG